MQTLTKQLEAVLFVAGRALTYDELATATEAPTEDVISGLELLQAELENRGLVLVRTSKAVQLTTAPETSDVVARFTDAEASAPLSKASLETLAIIIERQPVTKLTIEEVRGIASEQILKNLLGRSLIEEAGRSNEPGRPIQYAVTTDLMRLVGATSITQLREQLQPNED